MLPVIERLLILQDRDRRLIRLRAELDAVEPQAASLRAKAARAQADFEAVKFRFQHLESDRKKLELEVSSKQQLIDKCKSNQLSTKKNEEYRAFQHQIETTEAEIRTLEDQQLELMEKAEAASRSLKVASQEAAAAKAEVDRQIADLKARESNLETELEAAEDLRDQQAASIDASTLAKYERLLKTKGDNVVVGVPHGTCGGCHMKLPTQVILAAKAAQEIAICINCARMLYHTRDMED